MSDQDGTRAGSRLDELRSRVGETRTTIGGLRVEAGKVEEFARAIGDDDPLYRDREGATDRGFGDTPAPLTFTRTGRFERYRTGESIELGFRPEYTLHGAQAYEYDRPLLVGDVLRGETTVVDVTEREGERGGTMTFAEVETTYYDERNGSDGSDERVLTERATVIETDGAVVDDTEATASTTDSQATDGNTDTGDGRDHDRPNSDDGVSPDTLASLEPTAPEPVRAGDLAVGDGAPEVTVGPLERRDFVRYAGASGDFNPIHYHEPYAREAGKESVFGQGMFTADVAAHAIGDWFGVGNIETFAVRFRSRVWPGDTITASAEATTVEGTDDERVEADLRVVRDEGEDVLTGHAAATLGE